VAEAGRLDGEDGGWWPAVAPVSFYGTNKGMRSLVTSQMKKNDTRGGAHRGGKWRRRFVPNLARVAALRRSRLVHGLCGGGGRGAVELRC
jgi:hypothetical protein